MNDDRAGLRGFLSIVGGFVFFEIQRKKIGNPAFYFLRGLALVWVGGQIGGWGILAIRHKMTFINTC